MIAIVRIARSRPYTFCKVALRIALFGAMSARRMPTDILPNYAAALSVRLERLQVILVP